MASACRRRSVSSTSRRRVSCSTAVLRRVRCSVASSRALSRISAHGDHGGMRRPGRQEDRPMIDSYQQRQIAQPPEGGDALACRPDSTGRRPPRNRFPCGPSPTSGWMPGARSDGRAGREPHQDGAVGADQPGGRGGRLVEDRTIEGVEILMRDRYPRHAVELSVQHPPAADHEPRGAGHRAGGGARY